MVEEKTIGEKEEDIELAGNDSSDDSVENNEEEDEDEAEAQNEEPLTEEEIEELISELLEVESKAAEAQEALEEESLLKVEADVRKELAQSSSGDELDNAVAEEMETLKEEWEVVLDELETESAHLLEQLDGAGVDLSSLYKWIEKQAPNGCCTEAWKNRTHWVGNQMPNDASASVAQAEEYLQVHRPVRRRHGKILEEGASGFLEKKVVVSESSGAGNDGVNVDWDSFSKMCSGKSSAGFGSKEWASVYLASTPQQAAELGLKFPGVDEVEEIDDIDCTSSDPFVADAIANEGDLNLTEEQMKNFRKVKEEEDLNADRKLQIRLKQRRRRKKSKEDASKGELSSVHESVENDFGDQEVINNLDAFSGGVRGEKVMSGTNAFLSDDPTPLDIVEPRGVKRSSEQNELGDKEFCTITVHSDDETSLAGNGSSNMEEVPKAEFQVVSSSSDSDSDDSDANINVNTSTRKRRKKKIRRILDDAELGEETKKKIAIEKERQERLKSLEARFSTKSVAMRSAVSNRSSFDGTGVEMLGDVSAGYIINVVREEGEDPIKIPPSISMKLKLHQIQGIRFMWENIIQSVRKVKSGDKGLGCILAHTMGLGKTFQVIAFLYTAMRGADLGLRTALIVTPVSVLHNWRHEFMKWRPSELKALRIYMLEDVPREKRVALLMKWRIKGGVFLIGYSAFRNLSLGKYVKDRDMAREISHLLQEGPDILVCDEAHIIKNTRADTTQALKLVKCQRRIALTGSPLQNNLMEYYCMVDFVREGFLGSSHEFRNRFQNPIENGQHANSTAEDVKIMNQRSHILYEQLKGFVQRMDMNVVKKDLPPKTVFVITVKLSPLQRKLYKRFLDVHGFTKDKISGEKIIKRSFFAGYQALAQIWNHPGILQLRKENKDSAKCEDVEAYDSSNDEIVDYNVISGEKLINPPRKNDNGFLREDWWRDLLIEGTYKEADQGGKMVLLLDILKMCSSMGDKALVFSQSILTLDLIERYLSKFPRSKKTGKFWRKGKDWYRLDGRTESLERQKIVEKFNDPSNRRVKCTLISTRAGSLGINLHAANRVIIVDGSWNPTYDLQAIYRVWRYGQTKPVFAYRLLAHATMEEKIYKRQVTKEGLAARVVDRQQVHRTMSKEEILHLFEFGDDENVDIMSELAQDIGAASEPNTIGHVGNLLKQKTSLPNGSASSDILIKNLISRHHPSWIANYHEHETLLQENEDEKLSKEEQDLAWEVYQKTLEWEEVRRISPDENAVENMLGADVSLMGMACQVDEGCGMTMTNETGRTDPTWNERLVFRVNNRTLSSETSSMIIEIYAQGWLRDTVVGTVTVLLSKLVPPSVRSSCRRFVALQIRRPSGRPQGILNMGVSLLDNTMRSMPIDYHLITRNNLDNFDGKKKKKKIGLRRSQTELTRKPGSEKKPGADLIYNQVQGTLPNALNGGSVVNGSVCNSDVGPSPSVVAAAVAWGLYPTHLGPPPKPGSSVLEDWAVEERSTEGGLKSEIERWKMEIPQAHDPRLDGGRRRRRRRTADGGRLCTCFGNAYGCELTIVCGANSNRRRKNRQQHTSSKGSVSQV
ncbi:Protein CHROMATIN REMODELING 20 [Striga hermonthica]|uniref:Protein CHROMATIN REMODELING 20 n=1 Tax=Striga hermonthica TaxID=68872 RepID=A0A9N7MN26_STRHE|nr:Protein CHROMATIN REMODELING 20 [Striga hermonthica]